MTHAADRTTGHRFEPVGHVPELGVGGIGALLFAGGAWLAAAPANGTWRILFWTGAVNDVSTHWAQALVTAGLALVSVAFALLALKQHRRDHRLSGGFMLAAILAAGTFLAAVVVAAFWIL